MTSLERKGEQNDDVANNENLKVKSEDEENEEDQNSERDDVKIKICIHICEKKKRRCKFNAIKNSQYCVEHLAFNKQEDKHEKRIICPLDPKHSVYEKNFAKHLKKCNSRVKYLGDFDVKNINSFDERTNLNQDGIQEAKRIKSDQFESIVSLGQFTTYKELDEAKLKIVIQFLVDLDQKFNLYDLEFNKLENKYLNEVLETKNETYKKHLRQISSIVTHVDSLLDDSNQNDDLDESTCLIELGAGRGKLSYWFEQSRNHKYATDNTKKKKKLNILLIERGSQRLKFDTLLKKETEQTNSEFERIRIDLKDLFLNKVPLVEKSTNYILYGKHLCGEATDFALRCLKHSLDDKNVDMIKFKGFVLAVCCHHKCEYETFCGKEFLNEHKIDSKLFYIIRSISSWSTSGERNKTPPANETIFGHTKQKIGRICKNLFDYARLDYLKRNLIGNKISLNPKLFYYVEPQVTLENSMIYIGLNKE